MTSGASGPVAFKTLLTDFADYFDRAPRGVALATLQNFGVCTGTPFASYLRALRVVIASTVEKGGPLAPSSAMAIELVRIRTAQQYPMLMPTLFPGDLATREKPYVTLASMWTAFNDLRHNMSPAIDGDAFASATRTSGSQAPPDCSRSGSLHSCFAAPLWSFPATFAFCVACFTYTLSQGPLPGRLRPLALR